MNHTIFASIVGVLAGQLSKVIMRMSLIGKKLHYKILFGAVAIALITIASSGVTVAQVPLTAAAPNAIAPLAPSDYTSVITKAVTDAISNISNSSGIKNIGTLITGFFLVSLTIYALIKTMATGQGFGEFIGEMMPIFMSFAVVYLFTDKHAATLLVDMMGTIGSAVTGKTVSMNDYGGAVNSILGPIFEAISKAFELNLVSGGTHSDGILGAIANGVGLVGALIIASILKLLTLFLILLAAIVMLATVTMGYMSLQLALALAPIMVPFLMFRPLSWLFDGWLKFVIGAGMLFIVVVFFQMVTANMLTAMLAVANQAQMEQATNASSALDAFSIDYLLYAVMALLAMLSGMLMASAPSIANGLIAGGSQSIGFGGIRGLAHSTANRSFDGASRGAGQAALGAGRAGVAYKQGRSQGISMTGEDSAKRTGLSQRAYHAGRSSGLSNKQGPIQPHSHVKQKN